MQIKQDKINSSDPATDKDAVSAQKASPDGAVSKRMPAWTNALRDRPPVSLVRPVADLQAKGLISQPGDPHEQEADQIADQMMHSNAPGQSMVSTSLHTSAVSSQMATSLFQLSPMIQRAPLEEQGTDTSTTTEASTQTSDTPTTQSTSATSTAEADHGNATSNVASSSALIVEDDVDQPGPGQMKKSTFLSQLRDALSGIATDNASTIGNWFDYYSERSGQDIEQAIRTYIPEAAQVTAATDYIPLIQERVRQTTGIGAEGVDMSSTPSSTSPDASTSAATGGAEATPADASSTMLKRREGSSTASTPHIIQSQLGTGHPLEGGVKSRMESAFGIDFSHVRTHTDVRSEGLSNSLNARAFTVGRNVAFGPGEYQPGTLIGDALIAHELAHVVQQRGASASEPMQKGGTEYNSLEEDADVSAMGAVVSLWGGAKGMLGKIAQNALPNLRSGLRLQHCNGNKKPTPPVLAKIDDPKKYPTFEGWLRSFPAYSGSGISDNKDITNITPPDLQKLIAPSLGLPPDCADVSILLRHFYLKAWNQTFSFQAGPGKGKTFKIGAGVSDDEVRKALIDLGSINFQEDRPGTRGKPFDLVNFYKLRGVKIKNLKQLIDAGLKSGDIFVWNRLSTVTGNFEGHVQTVQDIDKAGKKITVVQGNMSAGQGVGELQQRQFTFQELTGNPDGDANIQPRPPASPEEEFFGGGPWR